MSAPRTPPRSAARILVDQLVIQGVSRVFCVPGESFLAVLDALVDSPIEVVTCRHEGAAAMMAEAYGKLTGRAGVVFCSRGPGATNASSGLHVAWQDSTPLVMFIGQNPRGVTAREGFQEVDYRRMFASQSKAVLQIDDAARTSELVTRAFGLAQSGRAGPVVVPLPEDMLGDEALCMDGRAVCAPACAPAPADMAQLRAALAQARHPVVLLGGGGWSAEAVAQLRDFVEASELPVAASFRRQDLLDNESPCYIGEVGLGVNPDLARRIEGADLLLVIGARLGEIGTNGYTLMQAPCPAQRLIHVYPSGDEIGHVYQPELGIVASPAAFVAALVAGGPVSGPWGADRAQARAAFETWTTPRPVPGRMQMPEVIRWLDANLPEDTIYTNGAGNFSVWLHRFHRYRRFGTQVAPICGSMGYGMPAALAAAFARPEARVICVAGDGDFQMTGTELATAVAHGLKIRVLIVNNGMLGTIRMHQERHYPGRVSATDLSAGNPDFTAFARSYGAYAERLDDSAGFAAAFARADAQDGPAVLELMLDPEALTPAASLSQTRQKALGAV